MPSTLTEEKRESSDGGATAKLRTLFFLPGSEYLARFEALLLSLHARGHEVLLALDHEPLGLSDEAVGFLDRIGQGRTGFRYLELLPRTDIWRIPASAVRRGLDYIRYLGPEYDGDQEPRNRARQNAPRVLLALLFLPPFRWSWGRRALRWVLARVDAAMPLPGWLKSFVAEQRPDVVLVSPLVDFGSGQADYVRRAQAQRIPTVLLVAGPDDLRSKGAIREAPTLTVVASDAQADEAVRLQGLPPDRVVAVSDGAKGTAAEGVVQAIEGTSASDVVRSHRGAILRPVLWVLTPVLLLVLPLLRAPATARRIRKRRRDRKALEHKRRTRAEKEARKERAAQRKTEAVAKAKAETQAHKEREREELRKTKEADKAQAAAAREAAKARAAEKVKAPAEEIAKGEKPAKAENAPKAERAPKPVKPTKAAKPPKRETPAAAAAVPEKKPAKTERAAAKAEKLAKSEKPPRTKASKARRSRLSKRVGGTARSVRRGAKQTRRSIRRAYNRRHRGSYAKTIHKVPSRDELSALLNARGLLGKGVEIGVKTGKYSDELLRHWRGAQLISVDPWLSADPDEYVDRSNVSQDEFERYYQITCERLAEYGERSDIWRMTSVEAAKKVGRHSLDFAYIDARHDYESVKEDLAAWCDKVRPGGILAGHDYVDGDFVEGEFYVKSAVDEFFGERGIPVHGTEGPSAVEAFPTWLVEVPEGGIEPPAQ